MAGRGGMRDDAAMTTLRVPPPTAGDRVGRALDRLAHPRLTHALAVETRGFRAAGLVRRYPNSPEGIRREALETGILWHRGYRPPLRGVRDAIWRTGGPVITIGFNRERVPAVLSERAERMATSRGVVERR